MSFPELCVSREFAAERINAIVNHPAVRPWVGLPGRAGLDLAPVVANPANYLLMGEGGGFLLTQMEPGLYEVHSQFLPEARGENVLRCAADASRYMFTRTDCVEIVTRVPDGNLAAGVLAKRMGWSLLFKREKVWPTDSGLVGCRYYSKTLAEWVRQEDTLMQSGQWFHGKLEAAKNEAQALPLHDDDDAHDRYVGAAVEMIAAGQVAKGIDFYNRWARFAGYGPIAVIATNPVTIDIGDAILAVRNNDFEVLLCR